MELSSLIRVNDGRVIKVRRQRKSTQMIAVKNSLVSSLMLYCFEKRESQLMS